MVKCNLFLDNGSNGPQEWLYWTWHLGRIIHIYIGYILTRSFSNLFLKTSISETPYLPPCSSVSILILLKAYSQI